MMTALCIVKGMLVIAEVSRVELGEGKCRFCGGQSFHENYGWLECDCGQFAILKEDHERITQTKAEEDSPV